jgi:hypothetical protein
VIAVLAVAWALLSAVGCAHAVVIDTEPGGGNITVDGEDVGTGPVTVERVVFFGDQLRVSVTQDGYEPTAISVPAGEWYPWPGLLAVVPLLGIPLSLPAFIIPFAGPFIAAAFAVTWAVVTSPTLLSLALIRKYPDTVAVPMQRRKRIDGAVLVPDLPLDPNVDLGANPIPDVGIDENPPPAAATGPPSPPKKKPSPPPAGGNPVP